MISHYDWPGGREAMLRFGPADGPVAIVALPLFEEANRTRTFAVTLLRSLAGHGFAGVLPDLPGTNDSLVATADARLATMRDAHDALVRHFEAQGRRTYAVGIRSGALIDPLSLLFGRWHLSPVTGDEVLRDLARLHNVSVPAAERVDRHTIVGCDRIEIAGNLLSSDMLADLSGALLHDGVGVPRRTVRLETDAKPADLRLPGNPLWRRAEPGDDPVLAQRLADDIAQWIRSCEG